MTESERITDKHKDRVIDRPTNGEIDNLSVLERERKRERER